MCIKGPKDRYDNKEIKLSIRYFVAKHLLNINKVLANIKRAGATILGHKSNFCYLFIVVVRYCIDKHSCYPNKKKINKIIN